MSNKIAIILWLYHTDLAEEFIYLLKPHCEYIHIFLGLCKDNSNIQALDMFKESFPKNLDIDYFDNAGTDILPTLYLLEKCYNKYQYFLKLHSKKNQWGIKKHVNWRSILLDSILYKQNFYNTITKLKNKNIGIVGTKSFIMKNNEYTNSKQILELCNILNINYKKLHLKSFIGGNIFAGKIELFIKFMHNEKIKQLLSQEKGRIIDDNGGTYVHSMERLFGYMAEYYKMKILGCPNKTNILLHPTIQNHRLHLVKLYNNSCYIQENPNIYGDIIDHKQDIVIYWKNTNSKQRYIYKDNFLINSCYVNTQSTT